MRRLFLGGRNLLTDERGAMLVLMAVVVVVMSILFAATAEFGRYLIAREQAQTAADAASLASALSGVKRWVRVDVTTDRGEEEYCDEFGCWCDSCGTHTVSVVGEEAKLVEDGGWMNYCVPECSCGGGDCWFTIRDRWVTYAPVSYKTAEDMCLANLPEQAEHSYVRKTNIHSQRGDPYYPSVTVYVRSYLKSLFPGFLGIFPSGYVIDACSQGDTFYRDPQTGKWSKAPPDACWKD